MKAKFLSAILCNIVVSSCATSSSGSLAVDFKDYISCVDDAEKYALRSAELQKIVNADQADRAGGVLTKSRNEFSRTDQD